MRTLTTIVGFLFYLCATEIISAGEYWLQLKELSFKTNQSSTSRNSEVVRSLEAAVTTGRPFYIRSVQDESQAFIYGDAADGPNGTVTIDYTYDAAALRGNDPPHHRLNGRVQVKIQEPTPLEPGMTNAPRLKPALDLRTRYVLTVCPFVPPVGFRYYSVLSVRLVDEAGHPVSNACAAFYDPDWDDLVVDPVRSNTNGIVHISGRAELPLITLLAEQRELGLFAEAHLDRNLSDYNRSYIYVITMRKPKEPPPLFQSPDIAVMFRTLCEER
jgi:hypothetical protein